MDLEDKLDLLMTYAADEREGTGGKAVVALPPRLRNARHAGALRPLNIRHVRAGNAGPKRGLLRILMTNACSLNCHYCPMRRDRDLPRTLLKPAEMVRVFLEAVRRGWCSGLFITTGIPGRPTKIADDLIEVLETLRLRRGYRGYVHVKLVPGADAGQVARITSLTTRVSINLETPCGATLRAIAPDKAFDETLVTLERARSVVALARERARHGAPPDPRTPGGIAGITTQFVVGATPDDDRAIIGRAVSLYAAGGVHHAHFSAFRPIRDTPMESAPAAPAVRERRLYQADHLIRRYGIQASELVFDSSGNLPLHRDPKLALALTRRDDFPVDVRTAGREHLLRVPGIGPVAARRIVEARRHTLIRNLADLAALGVLTERAAGFIAVAGRRLGAERAREQLTLWPDDLAIGSRQAPHEFSPGTFR